MGVFKLGYIRSHLGKNSERIVVCLCLTWFRCGTMDAPGKVCFNSPLSRRRSPDQRPRNVRWPEEGSCRVFPGKCRMICNHCKSPPSNHCKSPSWSSAPVAIKGDPGLVVRARRVIQGRRKIQIEGSCRAFSGKRCIIRGQRRFLSFFSEEDGVGSNQGGKGIPVPRVLLMRLWIADV